MTMYGINSRRQQPPLRRRTPKKRYTQATLLRVLFVMLGVIFVLYAALMVMIARRTHLYEHHTGNDLNLRKKDFVMPPGVESIVAKKQHILKAYLEHVDQDSWEIKPLPVRNTTAKDLRVVSYPDLTSCSKLPEQWPVDNSPDLMDAFLPWIHDVFPTPDGKFIQFVAQNRRRCDTGKKNATFLDVLKFRQPQLSLFQHIPLKRIDNPNKNGDQHRYRLSSHDEADPDAVDTRFICRFKPSMKETLAIHNINYDFASYRKGHKQMFTFEGQWDIKSLHTTQLNFRCPVPEELQSIVADGSSVHDDYATLFVDLIPVRTPPRYGPPEQFLPPRYREFVNTEIEFNTAVEWGNNHVLPQIDDSGRWENIPICKPSLMTYEPKEHQKQQEKTIESKDNKENGKAHRLVACLWASASYATRGERFAINDGQRRLREWMHFQWLVGFDHIYIYDNTLAHTTETSLKSITDEFPEKVTRLVWPAKVCNNRPNNVDSPGERSSQYAAESSCRLRFGPHVEWIGQFDIDEYLVPVDKYTSLLPLLDKLEQEGKKIVSFGSWRAWPRKSLIEPPEPIQQRKVCGNHDVCFVLKVPENRTILQTYNCDRQKVKKEHMPAEKQLYRPDYVRQHFVHYSTVTDLTMMNRRETEEFGQAWTKRIGADPLSRFADELHEGTMLHTKAIATQDTSGWQRVCKTGARGTCRIGNPWPPEAEERGEEGDKDGWKYNCYVNEKIDDYWVPLLEKSMGMQTSKK